MMSIWEQPETEAILAEIVRSSDDAIFSKNLDAAIMSWNPLQRLCTDTRLVEAIGEPRRYAPCAGSCRDQDHDGKSAEGRGRTTLRDYTRTQKWSPGAGIINGFPNPQQTWSDCRRRGDTDGR